MTTLLLIRHGESEANRRGIFAGQIDPDLQDRGLIQAKLTAAYMKEHYPVDRIYSSDLTRAYKTACALGELLGIEVIKEPGMREIYAGKWEGMLFSDLPVHYGEEYDLWLHHIEKAHCPDGESVAELGERIMNTLTKIAEENDGRTVAVATHATPIRVAQSMVQNGGLSGMERLPWVSNASVTALRYENGRFSILFVSEDKHLSELRTALPDNV